MSGLRQADADLLGLEEASDGSLAFTVTDHLCRFDGNLYGGTAIAAALAAAEHATGRTALWTTTQMVGAPALGTRIEVRAEVLASGRSVDQVAVRGVAGSEVVFNAVGAAATHIEDGLAGVGQRMPKVPPPEDCGPLGPAGARRKPVTEMPKIGQHNVCEQRHAELLDPDPARPGAMAAWVRLVGEHAPTSPTHSPAALGFLADLVPLAVARACGVVGGGTSLDNSLRLGEPAECEWVLLDLDAHVAVGGYGHGRVHLWSPDGRMLATGTQSARLFSMRSFIERSAAAT